MLEFFRNVAQTIPSGGNSPSEADAVPIEPMAGSAREMLQDRAGIIVLREDLDFYVIPPRADIEQPEMIEVKRAAGKALLKQDGIFSGLRRSEETGTTEQHLIEMLTAGSVLVILKLEFWLTETGASTMTIIGATEQMNPTRRSSAVSRLPDYEQTSVVVRWAATPWEWPKSYFFSGESPRADAGGNESSWRGWRVS